MLFTRLILPFILMFLISPLVVFAEEQSGWTKLINKAQEIASKASDAGKEALQSSKEGLSETSSFISEKYTSTKDGVASWSIEKYSSFAVEHPEVATNIEKFSSKASDTSNLVFEKAKGGAIKAYEVSADGSRNAVIWTQSKVNQLPEVTACGISELDMLGGVAIGTLGTALAAGTTTTTTTTAIVAVTPTMFGWVPIATSAVTSVVATPAVAIGVTATAIAGATVYATSKGLCYYQNKSENDQSLVEVKQ